MDRKKPIKSLLSILTITALASSATALELPMRSNYLQPINPNNQAVLDLQPKHFELKKTTRLINVWDDKGSGAKHDITIYQPVPERGYYILGNVVLKAHPEKQRALFAYTIRAYHKDDLASPLRYQFIGNDRKTGAHKSMAIYKPIPPAGYTCLGNVVTQRINPIHINNYPLKCVKSKYVKRMTKYWLANDRGSGGSYDIDYYANNAAAYGVTSVGVTTIVVNHRTSPTYGLQTKYLEFAPGSGQRLDMIALGHNDSLRALATAYAPHVRMHPRERFFPGDAKKFLAESLNGGADGYMRHLATSCNQPGCVPEHLHGDVNLASLETPAYVVVVPKKGFYGQQVTDIVYFFFYPYNEGKYMGKWWFPYDSAYYGNHVGDWEHITLRLVDGFPSEIYLSQHNEGQTLGFFEPIYRTEGGEHLVIYSAYGSHGSYLKAGDVIYKNVGIPGFNIDLIDEVAGGGQTWLTEHRLEFAMPNEAKPFWMTSQARWGDSERACIGDPIGVCKLEHGPTGPNRKNATNPNFSGLD